MMCDFVQNCMPHLSTNAFRVSMAILYNRALINSNNLWMWQSRLTVGCQRHSFIKSQKCITFFHTNSVHYLVSWFVLHSHQHIFHLFVKLSWDYCERLTHKFLKRSRFSYICFFTIFKASFIFILFKAVFPIVTLITFVFRGVHTAIHSWIWP